MDRRRFLLVSGGVCAASMAGCSESSSQDPGVSPSEPDGDDTRTVSEFRYTLENEFGIRVEELTVSEGVIQLAFTPGGDPDVSGTEQFLAIAREFAGLIEHQEDLDRLEVETRDARDDPIRTFQIDRELARQWRDGVLSEEQYLEQILETAERAQG